MPVEQKPVAAFKIPDFSDLTSIQLTGDEISAILTILGLVLRTLGLSGLADFVALLFKVEQGLSVSAKATPPQIVQVDPTKNG